VICFGSKSTEVSGEVPVDSTEAWARFVEMKELSFIINFTGSQRFRVHNPIGISSFPKTQSHELI